MMTRPVISTRRVITVAASLFAGGLAACQAQAQPLQSGAASMQPFPAVTVSAPGAAAKAAGPELPGLGGQQAVDGIGVKLDPVARWYGLTASTLRTTLLRDQQMRVASDGRLFVVDPAPGAMGPTAPTPVPKTVNDGQFVPLDQTFNLNSKPNADKTIYLNFTGKRLVGTQWNSPDLWNKPVIDAPPFDIDGSPTTFSSDELRRIQAIWQIVSEDYAPFDVNVTTAPVSEDRLTRDSEFDTVYGATVLITRSSGVFNTPFGGIAGVSAFGLPNYNTALVFGDNLQWNEKYVAEASSHEAGHTLGLLHDGYSDGRVSREYYLGHGVGDIRTWMNDPNSWAPIMGAGYYTNIVQFSKGEYPGANNTQDDFATIRSFLKPRPDEAGDTPASAAPLPVTLTNGVGNASVTGILTSAADRDLYAFTANQGDLSAKVTPAARSPDADLVLSLLDETGAVLASVNPPYALNADLSFRIPKQGTYYLQVNGTGFNDGRTPGYSAYGSIGNYTLTASYGVKPGTPPVASLTATPASGTAPLAVTLDASGSRDDGEVKFFYWDFGDGTTDNTGSLRTTTKTYAKPSSYRATVKIVDDQGLSATASQTIEVLAKPSPNDGPVTAQISLSIVKASSNSFAAGGVMFVRNASGKSLPNASVRYSWSGLQQGSRTITSRTQGVSVRSPTSKRKGCFVLTVTGITLAGYTYNAASPVVAQACR